MKLVVCTFSNFVKPDRWWPGGRQCDHHQVKISLRLFTPEQLCDS